MKLYLIRHGDIVYPHDEQGRKLVHGPNASLSALGRAQIKELSETFTKEGITFDFLYTSPYLRARQSAKILAENLGNSRITVVDGLKDVYPCSAEGKLWGDLEKIGGDIYSHPFNENQETLSYLVERSSATIREILVGAKNREVSSIGIVSHGDTLSAVNWSLEYSTPPTSYTKMRDLFYLQKSEACEHRLDEKFRLMGLKRMITIKSVQESIEGFRHANKERE